MNVLLAHPTPADRGGFRARGLITCPLVDGKRCRAYVHFERGDTFSYFDPATANWVQGDRIVPRHARESLTAAERARVEGRLFALGRIDQHGKECVS